MASRAGFEAQGTSRSRKASPKTVSMRAAKLASNDVRNGIIERDKGGRAPAPTANTDVSPPRHLIAETAYFIAERRGFAPGHEFEDWVQAEAEVKRRLRSAAP